MPHLFLPFGIVLILWATITRSYKLLVGTAIALGVSTVIALILDPLVWTHYRQMMSTTRIDRLPIPCLSVMMSHRFQSELYLAPNISRQPLAAFGALAFFRRCRDDWDWMAHGSLLMLVSVLVAPYSWLMDQAILIPALLHAAYLIRSRSIVAILALASAVIEIGILCGLPLMFSSSCTDEDGEGLETSLARNDSQRGPTSRQFNFPPIGTFFRACIRYVSLLDSSVYSRSHRLQITRR
jgi:hypothetical protein